MLNVLLKSIHYRYCNDENKDVIESKYYLQFPQDSANGWDLEISQKQFDELTENRAVTEFLSTSRVEMPKLNPNMPIYFYHTISVSLYKFKHIFPS